jgi:ectoine hydroxylase-related dioxygenase (phytanoyl-CoA dioxygenase family)
VGLAEAIPAGPRILRGSTCGEVASSGGSRHTWPKRVFQPEGAQDMTTTVAGTPTSLRAQLDAPYSVTPEQIEFYQANGFVKLKNVLSPEVIEYYRKEISAKVRELNTLHLPMEQRNTYQKAFLQVGNIWTKSAIVKELAFSKRLAKIAADLMKCQGVRLYHDQALYKEPSGGVTPWHADQYYWPLDTNNTITAWIPLQATPMELGPLAFSAGSHKFKTHRDLEISDESEQKISKTMLEQGLPLIATPFDLGEVSFHSGWTFHRAGPNRSNRPREVMTIIYHDKDAKVAVPTTQGQKGDLEKCLPGLKPGDVAACELTPVLFAY